MKYSLFLKMLSFSRVNTPACVEMHMLHVQKYLRSNKTLNDLKSEHGIKFHVHNKKISLSYDQIEVKDSDLLSQQCRGLILREDTFEIVACPMFRFFNLEQKELAANIDYNSAVFENKLDGSLQIVYYDNFQEKWCVATRSRPEANSNIDDGDLTFAKLFDIIVADLFKDRKATIQNLMNDSNKDITYCFELTSPFNRIVCQYEKAELTLLAARNNITLKELNIDDIFIAKGIKKPELFKFNNITDMVKVVRDWNPKEKEGVVVRDSNFNRIKVKNPAYISWNHMRDSLATSWRGCVEVILLKKDDDVIGMMPAVIADRIKTLKPVIQRVLIETQSDYDELKSLEPMKTFALEAQKRMWPGALFALKRNKTPDLQTFALGNALGITKIPTSATKSMLSLCIKLEPSLQNIELEEK